MCQRTLTVDILQKLYLVKHPHETNNSGNVTLLIPHKKEICLFETFFKSELIFV